MALPCKFRAWHHAACCMVHLLRRTMAVDQNHGFYQPEISTPQLLENTVTSQSPKMRAACPAVDKNTGQAHFGETIILLRIYLVGGLEHKWIMFHHVSHHIGKFIIPTVTQSIIFQRAWCLNHQWPGLKADPWRLGKLGEIKSWWVSLEKKSLEYYKYL